MVYELDQASDLTLDTLRAVAWDGDHVRFSARALQAVEQRRAEFVSFVEAHADQHLYGITTKHDVAAKVVLGTEERHEFGRLLPPTPPTIGSSLPERVVRAVIFARLADILHGTAALRPETAERLTQLLDRPLPAIPEIGNGEPGDIIALGRLLRPTFEGTLEVGEGMALINGSPVASAVLADAVLQAGDRIPRIEASLALSAVAVGLPNMHLDPHLGVVWGDPHQVDTLERLRLLLVGGSWPRRDYQAPVSFRSAPRVLGGIVRELHHSRQAASMTLSAASNNPIFVGPDLSPPHGAVLSNGGYHNPLTAPTLDALTHGWADLSQLVTAQINRLVDPPDGIAAYEPEPRISLFPMTASGWAEHARAIAQPSLIGLGRSGQTDTTTPDVLAWRRVTDSGSALDTLLSLLAIVAVHLTARRGDSLPPALTTVGGAVLDRFPLTAPPIEFAEALGAVQDYLATLRPLI